MIRAVDRPLVRLLAAFGGLTATAAGLAAVGLGLLALVGGTAVLAVAVLPGAALIVAGWYTLVSAVPAPDEEITPSDAAK